MKSTKYLVILACVLLSTLSSVAQQRFSKEEFKQKRAAFLKQELDLTPAEAARFIPLSEELMEKKFELNREAREKARAIRNRSNVSDAEYEQVIEQPPQRSYARKRILPEVQTGTPHAQSA